MKSFTKQKINKQTGFTLIELVVVIVILGILAVTAAPKFIDLQDDARTATLKAIKASMQSASSLLYSKSLIKGNETAAAAAAVFVTVNGVDVGTNFGYPVADYSGASVGSWDNLLEIAAADFTAVVVSGEQIYYPTGQLPVPTANTDACTVVYTQAADAVTPPVITVNDC